MSSHHKRTPASAGAARPTLSDRAHRLATHHRRREALYYRLHRIVWAGASASSLLSAVLISTVAAPGAALAALGLVALAIIASPARAACRHGALADELQRLPSQGDAQAAARRLTELECLSRRPAT